MKTVVAPPRNDSIVSLLLRIVIGGVLIYSGFSKAVGPTAEFAAVIDTYRLVPGDWAIPLATALPWVELWLGTFLLAGFFTRDAAWAAAVLFGVFGAALGSTLLRGIDLASCGCFGGGISMSPKYTLIIDVILLVTSVSLTFTARTTSPYSLDSWIEKGS